MTTNQQFKLNGIDFGIGLSQVSSLHQNVFSFLKDRGYFASEDSGNLLITRGAVRRPKRQQMQEESLANLKSGQITGKMSDNIKRKILKILKAWSTAIVYSKSTGIGFDEMEGKRLVMITLTLPAEQMHDDRVIKRDGLMMYLKQLIRDTGLTNYLWRAEPQKNGNIHFHILVDQFIPMQKVTELWNRRMEKLGYIEKFYERHKHRNPPSVKIEAIKDETLASQYIGKYVSKEEGSRNIEGRIWGCSDNLRNLERPEAYINNEQLDEILETAKNGLTNLIIQEHYILIKGWEPTWKTLNYITDNELFRQININNIKNLTMAQLSLFDSHLKELWWRDVELEYNQMQQAEGPPRELRELW